KLDPQYVDAYFALGHAYFDLKQWKQAIVGFQRAYELNPKDDQARDMLTLARTMAHQGPPPSAVPRVQSEPTQPQSVKVSMDVKPAPAPNELALTKIYRVGPNDVLDIRINDSDSSQSTLFTITPSGFLEHPLLAEPLRVGGLTVEEISAGVESELKRRALNDNPKVSIGVRDYASHTVLVSGLVKDSGTK